MAWPKPEEVAVLTVNGQEFRDWETVLVKHDMKDHPWAHFRFTCSEGMPLAKNWAALRILPGMECSVTLAGLPAIWGLVCSRQVFYDSRRHYIEIQGASNTIALAGASAIVPDSEFKKISYKPYATALLKNFPGMGFVEEGGSVPTDKFNINLPPGISTLEALEMPLRQLGSIPLTTNAEGDVVAAVGPWGGPDSVYEGDLGWPSILEGREIIYNVAMAQGTYGVGQSPGTDGKWGAKVASVPFFGNSFQSLGAAYSPQVIPLELPAWQDSFVKYRTTADAYWQSEDQITVFATVYGWIRPSGGLWARNQTVYVNSPMLVMDGGLALTAKSVTFTQDGGGGTRTILELMNKRALDGLVPPA